MVKMRAMSSNALKFLDQPAGLNGTNKVALPLYAARPEGITEALSKISETAVKQAQLHGFTGKAGQVLPLADAQGALASAVIGLGNGSSLENFGAAAAGLPAGTSWRIEQSGQALDEAGLAFLLGAYRYHALKSKPASFATLENATSRSRIIAGSIMFVRELINTPPNLLGPAELAETAMALAARFGAAAELVQGETLAERFPTIQAVGAGSDRPPAAVIFNWQGSTAPANAPLISLCGKGVCFDTGGYDLKPSAGMRLMRKDMGGAAIVLGLASAVMALDLPVRLELRIGCVENSVSGHAMRPSDILRTRSGLTVEIGNTDAEGRLVLCDLLSEASEAKPDWLINVATLTGAARVALGPDLPALFCTDDMMAETILAAGRKTGDQLWRLPLHGSYAGWLDSPFADLNNIASKPFAGAIVAALFLKHFVAENISWAHIDSYAWNDSTRPGKPEGGEAQTLQALLEAIENLTKR